MDADIDFDPDYCERLVQRFADDPTLGIASGTCYELEGGEWVRRTKSDSTVWGASRAYRWDCLGDVRALEPLMGWDGIDEVRVQLRGMRTETFVDLAFRHHRPEGGRESTSVHHWTPPRPCVLVHGLPAELPRDAGALPHPQEPGRAVHAVGLRGRRRRARRRAATIAA